MDEKPGPVKRTATNSDCERIWRLVSSVLGEYGLPADRDGKDSDLTDIEAHYLNRGGAFEILEDEEGNLLGTAGLYPIDEETVELRKMYFVPEIRGRGYGRQLLSDMVQIARELGFKRITLETIAPLKEAIHLYERFGFVSYEIEPNPRADRGFYLMLDV